MMWQSVLDDLTEKNSLIRIDIGGSLVRGVYGGLVRHKIYNHTKWYIKICKGKRLQHESFVDTKEVLSIEVMK